MATNLSVAAGREAANTAYMTMWEELQTQFTSGPFAEYTHIINTSSRKVDIQNLSNLPVMTAWVGARVEKSIRHQNRTESIATKEASLYLPRLEVETDTTGMIGEMLKAYLSQNAAGASYDLECKAEYDKASGVGPTGIDGVVLHSASHTIVPNTSNIGAGTNLSHAALESSERTMGLLQLENTESAGIVPTHLRFGPSLKRRAMALLGYDYRPAGFSSSTAEGGTTVATTGAPNTFSGQTAPIFDTRITTYYWDLLDLSKPNVRPMHMLLLTAPRPIVLDRMEDPRRVSHDEYGYLVEGDFKAVAGNWMTTFRGTGTA